MNLSEQTLDRAASLVAPAVLLALVVTVVLSLGGGPVTPGTDSDTPSVLADSFADPTTLRSGSPFGWRSLEGTWSSDGGVAAPLNGSGSLLATVVPALPHRVTVWWASVADRGAIEVAVGDDGRLRLELGPRRYRVVEILGPTSTLIATGPLPRQDGDLVTVVQRTSTSIAVGLGGSPRLRPTIEVTTPRARDAPPMLFESGGPLTALDRVEMVHE